MEYRWKTHLDRLSLHALYFSAASKSSANPDESVVGTGGARVGFFSFLTKVMIWHLNGNCPVPVPAWCLGYPFSEPG